MKMQIKPNFSPTKSNTPVFRSGDPIGGDRFQRVGPQKVMFATIYMLNGFIFTLPHISATFRPNLSILDAIQAEMLGED